MAQLIRHREGDELARLDPLAELNQLTSQLERYLQSGQFPPALDDGFIPLADVEETEDAFIVEIELPGVKRDDISVEVTGRRVVVTGERKERERTGILRRRARIVGRFHFEVTLPSNVNEEGVEALLEHGVLTLRIPKADSDRPRRITVK